MKKHLEFRPNPNAFRQASEMTFGRLRDLAEDMVTKSRDLAQRGPYSPKPPHMTGNNADSIAMKQLRDGEFIVHTESGYGGWLEIGTERMPARPYLRDGYRQAKAAAEKRR